jgi:V8-like Glu-specific endopeptidase
MNKRIFLLTGFVLISHLSAKAAPPNVIYGEDNRLDTFEVKSKLFLELAESTLVQIPNSGIKVRGSTAELYGKPLTSFTPRGMSKPVCEKERFSAQPTAGNCSGFLVGEDLLVTAGHCMTSESDCKNFSWVQNYKVIDENQTAISVDVKEVFKCSKIVKQSTSSGLDFALIKLDRKIPGRAVKIAKADPVVGTPLVMIGFPSGLPQKISDGARVTSVSGVSFKTNLDAFGGNSGSAVFNSESGELVGILVNGNADYRHNSALDCSEVNVLTDDKAGEGVSSFKQFISFL